MPSQSQVSSEEWSRRSGGGMRSALRTLVPRPARRALQVGGAWLEHAHHRAFERWYGIETAEIVELEEFNLAAKGRLHYVGIAWLPLRRALKALSPKSTDVFVDIGSGKGIALVVAGQFPFARVIGVELAEDLNRKARANLAHVRSRLRAREFEIVTNDVVEWPIPDDVSVVFLFCPFVGPAFEALMAHVFESHDRAPRPLHIVYAFPWEHNKLLATGRVEVVDVRPADWPAKPWWPWSGMVMPTYRVVEAGGTARTPPHRRFRGPISRKALERWSGPNDQRFALFRPGVGLVEDLE